MANLVVRNIDEKIVRVLKARAGKHGVSAEAEHRKILEAVLLKPKKKNFAEIIQSIPNVGEDADFERKQDGIEKSDDVFT
ncbi:MAG TPA: DNA-binding protein [Chromatiales bacterium]|nr:DNA-binding protein [Thiotrichales bacterium]HIP67487.1 DNA-binding protein [Chromatiales bacterium]